MIILIITIVGLCLGSFINALEWRLHHNSNPKISKKAKLSIFNGRSICPNCKHVLGPLDLIPVFSWLALRAKCHYCHKPISAQYPLVELTTAILMLFSYLAWPYGFKAGGVVLFVTWLLMLTGLVALLAYDIKYYLLPNIIVYLLILLAIIGVVTRLIFYHKGSNFLFGELWGLVFSAGLFYLIYQVSNGRWIGGGDVKLAVVIGLLLGGPSRAILAIFMASLIGTLICLPLLMTGKLKRTSLVPFGPFLIAATIISYLVGGHILDWYKTAFL
jgi:prepilin signal peptidase PulO-like enzyme (type II secretory pathway)